MNFFHNKVAGLLIFVSLFFTTILNGQVDTKAELESIAGNLVKKIKDEQTESIYLHIDKPVYRAGGTIWFRAYLLDTDSKLRSTLSKIVYVDLVNDQDSVIDYLMLNARDYGMDGGLRLSHDLAEGNYRIRSYTRHILEKNAEKMFITPVYIVSNVKPTTLSTIPKSNEGDSIQVGIYPEGGSMINGINNVIAIHIKTQGQPVQTSGYVKDDRDSTVARFVTNSSGRGRFEIFPQTKNRKYTVYVPAKNAQLNRYPLPLISVKAYQLSLVMQDSLKVKFRVGLGDSVYSKRTISYILGVSRGRVVFAGNGMGMYEVTIPKTDLPEGIATFNLYNDQKQEVSSRKIYVSKKSIHTDIATIKKNYLLREQVKMDITVRDAAGKPVPGIFSISVTDNRFNPPGYDVPLPVYYSLFNTPVSNYELDSFLNYSSATGIDMIMLTMNDNRNSPTITSFRLPADTSLRIQGNIEQRNNPIADHIVTLFSGVGSGMMMADTSSPDGEFEFNNLNYYDSTMFILQVSNLKREKKDMGIRYEPMKSPEVRSPRFPVLSDENILKGITAFRKNNADTSTTGNIKEWLEDVEMRSLKASSGGSKKNNKFSRFITAEQLDKLQLSTTANAVMMLPGVIMMNGRLTIRGGLMSVVGGLSNIEPLIVVDGIPVPLGESSAVDYLNSIPPGSIEYIEVLSGPEAAMYATRAGNGVILIKTANQVRTPPGKKDGMTYIYPKGYHVPPLFYMPKYNVDVVKEFPFTDNRATIYWNGEVMTNKDGKANVIFYVADEPATYTITLQGITSKGELVYERYVIKRGQ